LLRAETVKSWEGFSEPFNGEGSSGVRTGIWQAERRRQRSPNLTAQNPAHRSLGATE